MQSHVLTSDPLHICQLRYTRGCWPSITTFQMRSTLMICSHKLLCSSPHDATEMPSIHLHIWTVFALTVLLIRTCRSTELSLQRRVNGAQPICRADFGAPGLSGCLAARAAIQRSSRSDADRLNLWLPPERGHHRGSPGDVDDDSELLQCGRQWPGGLPREPR